MTDPTISAIDEDALARGKPELSIVHLGVMPLVDSVPLIAAAKKGFAKAEGLDLRISVENSWSGIRDKVTLGRLDGAQMLAPMPIATRLGLGHIKRPMIVPTCLSLNGNAITLSEELIRRMQAIDTDILTKGPTDKARVLKQVAEKVTITRGEPPTLAMVFPFSGHNYELRYWLASGGIDPDRDVRLIVVPPPLVAENLEAGLIDGYCVGEPWNGLAADKGFGRVIVRKADLFPLGLEKVLGVTEAWAAQNPGTLGALVRAVVNAALWCDAAENRKEAAKLLAVNGIVNAPERLLTVLLETMPEDGGFGFYQSAATYPWRSQAGWILAQMVRWGQAPAGLDPKALAASTFRPDLYRLALSHTDHALPLDDWRREGDAAKIYEVPAQNGQVFCGPDRFFDREAFDMDAFDAYVRVFQ